ncbi:hypothetical protein L21SP5_03150 [Salinivirga cyanobacteriivorans]|uniref:Uncharacterized protein n=1 Tax=Salinivirga cyanobacteriivorans TaxID=1307839 RepID=A0A0S2I3M6_9BACT|nr:hypothetical protein [Salinivirga cyanobacteriivorans]ALO16765.1 hypothetical protein L21SP5_03150 [Salinivirga cyanobacteriivorans]
MEKVIAQKLKSLRFVYMALIIGVISFILIAVIINYFNGSFLVPDQIMYNTFLIVSNVFFVVGLLVAVYITKKKLSVITTDDLESKLDQYREAILTRGAILEGTTFLFVACYLMMGFHIFLIETIIGILALAFFFPTNRRIAEELKIDVRQLS